jgi:hypothetical protein
MSQPSGAEHARMAGSDRPADDWYLWGPYLSERQWGTVREDYSPDGGAWSYLPHDHARSRAYRWGEDGLAGFSDVEQRLAAIRRSSPRPASCAANRGTRRLLVGAVGVERVTRRFRTLFDPAEFLSPYGLRSLSAYHRDQPYTLDVEGVRATEDYEPAESTTDMFGGNSNWRGPVWLPLNFLATSALERYHRFFGDDLTVEYPTGSGRATTLDAVAADLWARLVSIFTVDPDGRRPRFDWVDRARHDPAWRDNVTFSEYFHGDNAAGLGAGHQTGWTGIVADIIRRRHGMVTTIDDVLLRLGEPGGRP